MLDMKDQIFKAKCLMDPFFKKRVMTKVRRYEDHLRELKRLKESYGEESETEDNRSTLVHAKRV